MKKKTFALALILVPALIVFVFPPYNLDVQTRYIVIAIFTVGCAVIIAMDDLHGPSQE